MTAIHRFFQFIVSRRFSLTSIVRAVCLVTAFAAIAAGSVGCGDAGEPVATVVVGVNRPAVPLGGPIELSFRFVASPRLEPLDEDYRVLVHYLDGNGDLMWADDHEPAIPTSQWQPGQSVAYTRHAIVPMYPYIGEAVIAVGLYSAASGERLPLAGEDVGQRAYRVAVLTLEPQAESSFLLYENGWYGDEFDPDTNTQWRWTAERASLSLRNPHSDAVLYLRLGGRPDLFPDQEQLVSVYVGDELVRELLLESRETRFEQLQLQAAQLGETETARITLAIEPTFVPSEIPGSDAVDDRRLGVRVYYAFLETR